MIQMELPLKIMSVKRAVKTAYDAMPVTFSALTLCLHTRSILNKMTMDGTILRRLRESGECPYEVKDNVHSIYKKA